MGIAPHWLYACLHTIYNIVKWVWPSQLKNVAEELLKGSIQLDLLFADFIIVDITSELKNRIFAEIVPCIFHLLYGLEDIDVMIWFIAPDR